MELKLSGWKAILAIVAVIGFLGFKFVAQTEALHADGVEKIRQWLVFETARFVLPEMKKALENPTEHNTKFLSDTAKNFKQQNFEIISVTRRGLGERIIARVDVRFKGKIPKDGMNVRYLRMKYSMLTGWRVERETSKWNYYLASF